MRRIRASDAAEEKKDVKDNKMNVIDANIHCVVEVNTSMPMPIPIGVVIANRIVKMGCSIDLDEGDGDESRSLPF